MIILTIIIVFGVTTAENLWIHRNPRYLPFPVGLGNKLQIITGFGIPVDLKEDSVTFGLIMKTNYALPTNSAYFTRPEEAFEGWDEKMNRWTWYSLIKSIFERLSLDGESCLLRSICQAAFVSFEHSGLLGEILRVLLVPSSSYEKNNQYTIVNEYEYAETIGRTSKDDESCSTAFPNCTTSLMDIISTIENNPVTNTILQNVEWLK